MTSATTDAPAEWLEINRANWDERVSWHLDAPSYDLGALRAGQGRLYPIEQREIGDVRGKRILHLQCHFGRDSLALAQQGAEVVGLDFSPAAVEVGNRLAAELGLAGRARFVEANVYDAPKILDRGPGFDIVFVTWGSLCWLPDLARWAAVVAHFLRPGGHLYLADAHPAAMVLEDLDPKGGQEPVLYLPYFIEGAIIEDDPTDYANKKARLKHSRTHEWMHTLAEILTSIARARLRLEWFNEHPEIPWRMFADLVETDEGLYRWPAEQWMPLAFSLKASA
ncbi:class I SAM-dependent methyltransferase [Methylobrevis pamukkalensis]|uniref:Ubiquinone biosynthesis O-methyltransferase n=1 Tax=Methylobrevis pamukkalensis TaxID=1439726 RepID=A0A1E3H5R5_9HYPH|nr:class I SAM-dependent methyltransferase [Methylobrevis pamukkalensis]ODN71650.1 Ubiquinone biosynthesis O-methyltransferase [Methylobrevis pamukkalensis]